MFDIIQAWDLSILMFMRSLKSPVAVWAAWGISALAWKGWLWWLSAVGIWVRGNRLMAAKLALGLTIATVAGLPLKSLIARARPDLYASQQLNIPMPELLSTTHSFPSGHTLLAAVFAFVVMSATPVTFRISSLVFVVLVGLARIYEGMHWPSDVVGSILLGWLAAVAAEKICHLKALRSRLQPLPNSERFSAENLSNANGPKKMEETDREVPAGRSR